MHKHLRWAITTTFYSVQLIILYHSLNNETIWILIVEPFILIECFIALGLIASDYLTPSLSRISKDILQISDKVSGLTLLSLGNSIPDITSTYQAMSTGATSLALGELLGGIFFLMTVVLGIMAFIKPIKLRKSMILLSDNTGTQYFDINETPGVSYSRADFYQDILMFGALVLMSGLFLADGRLMFWECITMVLAYSLYTSFLILQNRTSICIEESFDNRASCRDEIESLSAIISNSGLANNDEQNILLFNNGVNRRRANIRSGIRHYLRSRYHGWVKITLSDCLEIWENEANLNRNKNDRAEENSIVSAEDQIYVESFAPPRRATSLRDVDRTDQISIIYGLALDNKKSVEERDATTNTPGFDNPQELTVPMRPKTQKSLSCDCIPNLPRYRDDESNFDSHIERTSLCSTKDEALPTWPQRLMLPQYISDEAMYLPVTEYLALLFTTPPTIVLSCLIPYLGHIKCCGKLHVLEVVRLTMAPIYLNVLFSGSVSIWTLAISGLLGGTLIYRYFTSQVRTNEHIVAVAGFLLSLSMIYLCVHIVVRMLTDWSTKLDISPSILGLTFFAWGNSMGDLVSNVIFADIGVIELALGACFGSPLLYFVFGVGINGIFLLLRQKKQMQKSIFKSHLSYVIDPSLEYTALGIVLAFLIFLIAVPFNNWRIDKRISILLLLLYAAVTIVNVLQEIK
ncbi:hypothetical protein HG535_0F05050 [Zygotorulaspora mrakii]|uniref:Sodium/calcium exchanger membrane region domain-containing protein n=1 Tax=Zygotorulaspora mrakii TaxID=42260 RepID=A0A7H9B661_ZYGMR|nr:uncharacterized protein HG535_0F05050 [Zygotorulaspora mrakii]QLG73993.1 hypothetical protein HG535_0F05050 [Zygotorulaspora mrakii]